MKRIISISICMVFLLSASTIFLAQEKIEEEPMTFGEFQLKVRSIIKCRNDELEKHFKDGKYELMPGQLKEYNAKVVTHKGKIIPGRYSEDYWRKVGGMKGTNLKFNPPHLDFMDLGVDPDAPGYEINYVAVEITKFSFDVKGKKHKGYIDPTYRHRVRCDMH